MGMEVSSQRLQHADSITKMGAGSTVESGGMDPCGMDASAKDRFEKIMEQGSGGHGSEQDSAQDGQRSKSDESMPSSVTLMESLFKGRMEGIASPAELVRTVTPSGGMDDVGALVDTLVERILVSDPGRGAPEVRITLSSGTLAGTELSLSRAVDGQLCVHLGCADSAAFQTAVGAQGTLRAALERQGETVRLEISQGGADGGNEGDTRRRSATYEEARENE